MEMRNSENGNKGIDRNLNVDEQTEVTTNPPKDRSPKDRSPKDRSPKYRSPKYRFPRNLSVAKQFLRILNTSLFSPLFN